MFQGLSLVPGKEVYKNYPVPYSFMHLWGVFSGSDGELCFEGTVTGKTDGQVPDFAELMIQEWETETKRLEPQCVWW